MTELAYANILVKNVTPRENDRSIPLNTIFKFDLVPFNGATLDMSTFSVAVRISGGPTKVTQNLTFVQGDDGLTLVGNDTDGYSVSLDVFTNFDTNFDNQQSVVLTINVSDTDATPNAMRQVRLQYHTVRRDQLDAFKDLISEVTEISVYREQARINSDGTVATFTYRNWNWDFDPVIYKNGLIMESGYSIDKLAGKITFDSALDTYQGSEVVDIIEADYRFSVFSDSELINFMYTALTYFNAAPRHSSFSLSGAPASAQAAILYGGAFNAINSILWGFLNQQSRVKWGETEWKDLQSMLQNMRDTYKGEMDKILEYKKLRLPAIGAVAVPEYNLPGGRSRFFRYLYKEGGNM